MVTQAESINARSWLFAPGDSERKMEKATAGVADIVLLDLEDAVAEGEKPNARSMVTTFLKAHPLERARLWVAIPAASCCPKCAGAPMSSYSTTT